MKTYGTAQFKLDYRQRNKMVELFINLFVDHFTGKERAYLHRFITGDFFGL